jgi:hypothetical protein
MAFAHKSAVFRYNYPLLNREVILKLILTHQEKKVLCFVLILSLLGGLTLWLNH